MASENKDEIYFDGKLLCHTCSKCGGKGRIPLTVEQAKDRSYGHNNYNVCYACYETGKMLTEDGAALYQFMRTFFNVNGRR